MHANQLHYLPLSLPFFSILAGIFVFLIVLLRVGVLRYAYMRLGFSARAVILVLLGSLVGSYFNIPLAEFPEQHILSGQEIDFFGIHYMVPVVADWPGTIVAVNVGGALIPGLISLYLLVRHRLWVRGALVIAGVSAVCHLLAKPVAGLGIALPIFVPAIASALVAVVLSWRRAAPLAYIGGSLGALVGADLLNLGRVQGLGAPVVSIGGAGTFDGVFLTGILAVLLAGLCFPAGLEPSASSQAIDGRKERTVGCEHGDYPHCPPVQSRSCRKQTSRNAVACITGSTIPNSNSGSNTCSEGFGPDPGKLRDKFVACHSGASPPSIDWPLATVSGLWLEELPKA